MLAVQALLPGAARRRGQMVGPPVSIRRISHLVGTAEQPHLMRVMAAMVVGSVAVLVPLRG